MARVTLIRPPVLVTQVTTVSGAIPPLGLAYVAGTLRAHGHDVTCIDAPGEALGQFKLCDSDPGLVEVGLSIHEIVDRIPASSQVIGLSCMFSFEWFHVMELIRAIRARFPTQLLVLGGEHASADHTYILKNVPEVDVCVLGEGEHKMLALVQAFESGIAKKNLPGTATFDPLTRAVRKNQDTDGGEYRIADVDSIARPAWDLLPLEAYLNAGVGHGSLGFRSMPMLASRGCPHRCTFCSSPQMWTTRWKARDVEDVIDEIKTYVARYRINQVLFYDLTAIVDKQWIIRFCERLLEEKLSINWAMPSGTRTEALTPEVLSLLKASGVRRLIYPLETGNKKTCDLIKKKIEYRRSLSSMRNAVREGFVVGTTVVFGFPFQSYRDILMEFVFVLRVAWIGARDIMFHPFAPYPGSELHEQLVAEGKIVKDENYPTLLRTLFSSNYASYQSWNPRISARMLRALGLLGMAEFYFLQFLFRPHRLIGSAYRICVGKPVTLLELALSCTLPRLVQRRLTLLEPSRR